MGKGLSIFLKELWVFGLKQAYACLFGALLLGIMIITKYWYPQTIFGQIHRYDFIFFSAIAIQAFLFLFKLETPQEAIVIVVFHVVATLMELFKTSPNIASWHYPELYTFGIGNVPLFTGFMYSAVGSYIARVWRIFDFRFSHYPKRVFTVVLVMAIYANFFTHHYWYDCRWILLMVTAIMFWKTQVYFKVIKIYRHMSLMLGWFFVALFIWFAENLATYANIWLYPNQNDGWQMVPLSKLTSWYLLMLLSFVLVSLIHQPQKPDITTIKIPSL